MSIQVGQAVLFADVVRDRHSVRKYDASWTISKEEMTELLQEATLAPSGANVQPWRFLVIDDAELKKKLLPIAYNQEQVIQASAVVAILGDLQGIDKAEQIYSAAVDAGYMSEEAKEQILQNLRRFYSDPTSEVVKRSSLIDGSLVSMQFMLSAKARGYDTVPMGGYDEKSLRSAFHISDRYSVVMLIAVGKAAQEAHKTVRLPVEEVTFWNAIPEEV
ncbi:nitroreductase family protein [Paenibacillus radicis (ex Xue et al. 2023)]|uniref:Nitroreductase family protein n=1 Tax=Paenibacillus radicis (ex Xue et al. 2023) TaxID=2972489 RepID=A0ABT1YJZ3_9BACL|nr:nitroreductase family protein [Paenibacillus radicis (ex Xue et al. 2023)]MCR8632729.1 nitroreductase family protein [Paenibacillus radicis (ex Xue et al. 2023)]